MNSQHPTAPNFNLPEPVDTQVTESLGAQNAQALTPQQAGPMPESAAPTSQNAGFSDVLNSQQIQSVEQAVRQNIDDPRALSLRLDEIRAEYIAGRFAKDIKRQGGDSK